MDVADYNTMDHDLEPRASLKGNPWGITAGAALTLDTILSNKVDSNLQENLGDLFNAALDAFACKKCFSCLNGDENESGPCCGCTCMDYTYGLTDMPGCDECDDVNNDGGGWPGTESTLKMRGPGSGEDDEETLWWLDDDEDATPSDDSGHFLAKRPSGTATKSYKDVTVCGDVVHIGGNGKYPAFPASASWPWDGIENNRYAYVSAYWGNTSADCADWSVGQLITADTRVTPTGTFRAAYDSKTMYSLTHSSPLLCEASIMM